MEEDMSSYAEGQTHQLANALEAANFTPDDITKLGQSQDVLRGLKGVCRGTHEIRPIVKAKVEKPEPIERIRTINETTIMVNLDAPPKLPFDGANIKFQVGSGWVRVEKRADGLYVDGRKVILYLSERQKGGKVIRGYELREEISGKSVLHPNIMDALFENQHLIPEDWKKDEKGNTRYIFFWAVIFCGADGGLFVRCFYFCAGQWRRYCDHLGCGWVSCHPAALLAS